MNCCAAAARSGALRALAAAQRSRCAWLQSASCHSSARSSSDLHLVLALANSASIVDLRRTQNLRVCLLWCSPRTEPVFSL